MSAVAMFVLAAAVVLAATFIVAAYRQRWEWAGFAGSPKAPPKTLWDWLDLLVVPLALAAVAFALNLAQSNRDHRREDQRAREDALATYLQQMSNLLLEHKQFTPREERALLIVRELTLSVLPRLDGRRKGIVAQFLAESGLIKDEPAGTLLNLSGADLRGAVLHGNYNHTVFESADLRGADFRNANLVGAVFAHADLRQAVFDGADLEDASLSGDDLRGARFTKALVYRGHFAGACLSGARFTRARLSSTDFAATGGHDIDFSGAALAGIDLSVAAFSRDDVNLTGAVLLATRRPSAPGKVHALLDPCTSFSERAVFT
jgi:Pentapeptide repeats (8 copies)